MYNRWPEILLLELLTYDHKAYSLTVNIGIYIINAEYIITNWDKYHKGKKEVHWSGLDQRNRASIYIYCVYTYIHREKESKRFVTGVGLCECGDWLGKSETVGQASRLGILEQELMLQSAGGIFSSSRKLVFLLRTFSWLDEAHPD